MARHSGSGGEHSARSQTGLRNRYRSGGGSYSSAHKGRRADTYKFDLSEHTRWMMTRREGMGDE